MNPKAKSAIKFTVRWGIAVLGIGWVLSNLSCYNRVLIEDPATGRPTPVRLAAEAQEGDSSFEVLNPFVEPGKTVRTKVERTDLFVKSDTDKLVIHDPVNPAATENVEVLGLKVTADPVMEHWPIIIAKPRTFWMKYSGGHYGDRARLIDATQVVGDYHIRVPYPVIDAGLLPMTQLAIHNNPWLLVAAVLVFPVTFIITSFRWHMLMEVLGITMGVPRTFKINMVGAFYNTFMPGSTGGDVLKAYYAAKLTPSRTRAVMSVIVDRVIGLEALVLLGGAMAAFRYFTSHTADAATHKCGQVAVGSALIVLASIVGLIVFYLRRPLGLNFLISKLPMQRQINNAIETMELYRRHPLKVLWTILVTLPVHGTVVLSAMFAGKAFGLNMVWWYYFVAIPVVVLAGSVPISPQGAGVMEFFMILLTRSEGVTISQAFALTMSIRIVQIIWNLTGGVFVMKGGFHAPTDAEKNELEADAGTIPPQVEPA